MRSSVMKPGDLVQIKDKLYSSSAISSLCFRGPGLIINSHERKDDFVEHVLAEGIRSYFEVLMPLKEGGTKVLSFFMHEIEIA